MSSGERPYGPLFPAGLARIIRHAAPPDRTALLEVARLFRRDLATPEGQTISVRTAANYSLRALSGALAFPAPENAAAHAEACDGAAAAPAVRPTPRAANQRDDGRAR